LQIDAIVTETYLGAPQRGGEQRSALVAELAKIEKLYQEAAPELFNILKENGVLVLCVPEYRLDQERLTIASQEILEGAGFIRQDTRFDPLVYHHEAHTNLMETQHLALGHFRESLAIDQDIAIGRFLQSGDGV
jgi:hypothetical protein